ncbi:unnamed protein product [Alopecurus aequalis]
MPPVDMSEFAHLGFAYVDPETTSPGPIILAALYDQVPDGMVACPVAAAHGAHLVVFRSTQSREFAVDESPFVVAEHSHSVGGLGNPMEVAHICLSGRHYIAVLVVCKYEVAQNIPAELDVKNSDGAMTTVEVRRVRQWPLCGAMPPPPPFGPGGGGPGGWGGPGGGGGGPGGSGGGPRGGGGPSGGGPSGGDPSSSRPPPLRRRLSGEFRSLPAVLHPAGTQGRSAVDAGAPSAHDMIQVCPAAAPPTHGALAFSAITPGGVPHPISSMVAACPDFFHLLLRGEGGEVGYFRVPRELAGSDVPGPRGLPHINLDTGAVGTIDSIELVPGVASSISSRVLADAVVCADPLMFAPDGACAPPATAPTPTSNVAEPVRAPKRGHEAMAPPPRVSARLREKEGRRFESVAARASRLRVSRDEGTSSSSAHAAPPPFSAEELLSMAEECQLPDDDVRRLVNAMQPAGAP